MNNLHVLENNWKIIFGTLVIMIKDVMFTDIHVCLILKFNHREE